jgi:ring-1,2-phenylacetyl-CoA epoxidase subunit PaaD
MVTEAAPRPITQAELAAVRSSVENVTDPEVPVLTLGDLGIVRDVRVVDDEPGTVEVDLTPTYSGCPATEVIARMAADAVRRLGLRARVRTVLSPPWTTDWMTADGRRKLKEFGIAPPTGKAAAGAVLVTTGMSIGRRPAVDVACPRCGSQDTGEVSRFGSTACKSLWQCQACHEPVDHFKAI